MTDAGVLAGPAETGIDGRRAVAVVMPAAVPAAMIVAFTLARDRFGVHTGYVVGFGVYWATCATLSLALIGRRRAFSLFRRPQRPFGRPAIVGAALLVWPVAGAVATRFIPEVASATFAMLATIVGVALVNSLVEEMFWRGTYITLWPDDKLRGVLWPALGFGAWHFAPQVINPSALGPAGYVAAAMALGLSWGWVGHQSGSLRWVWLSHLLADASGIRNALLFMGR